MTESAACSDWSCITKRQLLGGGSGGNHWPAEEMLANMWAVFFFSLQSIMFSHVPHEIGRNVDGWKMGGNMGGALVGQKWTCYLPPDIILFKNIVFSHAVKAMRQDT